MATLNATEDQTVAGATTIAFASSPRRSAGSPLLYRHPSEVEFAQRKSLHCYFATRIQFASSLRPIVTPLSTFQQDGICPARSFARRLSFTAPQIRPFLFAISFKHSYPLRRVFAFCLSVPLAFSFPPSALSSIPLLILCTLYLAAYSKSSDCGLGVQSTLDR